MLNMTKSNTILSYKGHLSYETIGVLLNAFKKEIEPYGLKISIYKKILSIMIESLENIYRYRDSYEYNAFLNRDYLPFFNIEAEDNIFIVSCGNPVLAIDIEKLRAKIERVNSLDREGLKFLYKSTITNGRFSHKGGAGLGFIEMAKVSGNRIDYKFDKINEEFSFFTIQLKVAS
jgi:hypothetical protein